MSSTPIVFMSSDLAARLDAIEAKLDSLLSREQREYRMVSAKLKTLIDEVRRDVEVDSAAKAAIDGLLARFEEVRDDPEAIDNLIKEVRRSTDELATAVAATQPPQPSQS
jgi:Zn-dependent M32 family carboxypeptidase